MVHRHSIAAGAILSTVSTEIPGKEPEISITMIIIAEISP
jgi:hypothetical protein